MPEVEKIENIKMDINELRIDTYRILVRVVSTLIPLTQQFV